MEVQEKKIDFCWQNFTSRNHKNLTMLKQCKIIRSYMFVFAVAVSHSPARAMMSNPVDSWLKNRR